MTDQSNTPAAEAAPKPDAAAAAQTPPTAETKPAEAAAKPDTGSLLPPADAVEGEAPAAPAKPAAEAPKPSDAPEWLLYEGVKGTGELPEWYRADKYATVADQAKAYAELEKRFGAFSGAPKDGKYAPPEGLPVELDTEHPLLGEFGKWASENNVSQKAYDDIIGMLATYEASLQPSVAELKNQIGEGADARLADTARWAKANLTPDEYGLFQEAVSGPQAATVFKAVELLISKTRQPSMPKAGADVAGAVPSTLDGIFAERGKLGPDGKRLYDTDARFRKYIEDKLVAYYNNASSRAA